MTYSVMDDKYIYTYEIENKNKGAILEELKQYSTEKVIEQSYDGPYGVVHNFLLDIIQKSYDEIIDYEFIEGKGNSVVNVTIVAVVRLYPDLYRIINDAKSIFPLINYINGDVLITSEHNSEKQFTLAYRLYESNKQKTKHNYDLHISLDKKIEIIRKYISSLTVNLIKKESITDIKNAIDNLNSMKESYSHLEQLSHIQRKISDAKTNTDNFKLLCELLNLKLDFKADENKLIKKI